MQDDRDGTQRIADERQRQKGAEGWSDEHDDGHGKGELALAAACYATPIHLFKTRGTRNSGRIVFEDPWPWDEEDDKRPPGENPTREQRIRLLEKAGALIAAEIDRLLRLGK